MSPVRCSPACISPAAPRFRRAAVAEHGRQHAVHALGRRRAWHLDVAAARQHPQGGKDVARVLLPRRWELLQRRPHRPRRRQPRRRRRPDPNDDPVDVYEIRAADPYPDSYDETVARNVREQNADARPAIADPLPNVDAYETVLVGSPIWNLRRPMIMSTFLDNVDHTGKRLAPFVTYAVSGLGRTIDVYTDLAPDAAITDGLAVRGEEAADSAADVGDWLRRLGLLSG